MGSFNCTVCPKVRKENGKYYCDANPDFDWTKMGQQWIECEYKNEN